MATQHVVLVAGFNYKAWPIKPNDRPDGTSFTGFCKRRMEWLLKKMPNAKVSLFDFGAGVLDASEKGANGKRSSADLQMFKKPTRANNYTDHDFTKNADGVMSIMDVYHYVEQIGKKDPGTLVELSIFSHALYEGPILVNSYDHTDGNKRDDNDKDGRHKKDFIPPNMAPDGLSSFQKAFARGGSVWVWGCDASSIYRHVFERIAKTSKYRTTAGGRLRDSDVFTFEFTPEDASRLYHQDSNFFPAKSARGSYPLKFDRTVKQIKKFFEEGLNDTYSAKIAAASKVLTYAALPGTWASLVPDAYGLMHVPKTKKEGGGDDFSALIDFYGWYVGAPEDPENRGYGTFMPRA
jgi:hypothetical protein